MTTCTRCEGTGFLNAEQLPGGIAGKGVQAICDWIVEMKSECDEIGGCHCAVLGRMAPCGWCLRQHDVTVCDCCGDGDSEWHGEPGAHYGPNDPPGDYGPYAYNGGLCECH